jgi:hypothetical protein
MKFSFLGFNAISRPLAEAILAHPEHQFVAVFAADEEFSLTDFPGVQQEREWEAVLHNSESDMIVISPHSDQAAQEDRLRRVVQCELPAIAIQPYCNVLAAFEMDMIQVQTSAPLICYSPADHQSLVGDLNAWITDPASSPLGRIWQIAMHSNPDTIQRAGVLKQLAYDISVVRNIAGTIRQVNATTNSVGEDVFDNLNIIFTTDSPSLFAWYLDQSLPARACELKLTGDDGDLTVVLSQNHACWQIKGETNLQSASSAETFLKSLPETLSEPATNPSWLNWCQDLDVAETVPTSLRRRRTIDMLDEARTEEGAFKGVMSIGGCALLLATMFALLAGTIIEGFRFPFRKNSYQATQPEERSAQQSPTDAPAFWIRLWPVYPFALFLLLQFLRLIIKSPAPAAVAKTDLSTIPRGPPG